MALTSTGNDQRKFIVRDVGEIVIGSRVLAFLIAVTEEVWRLSETLPLGRVIYLTVWSVIFIAVFTYHHYFQS